MRLSLTSFSTQVNIYSVIRCLLPLLALLLLFFVRQLSIYLSTVNCYVTRSNANSIRTNRIFKTKYLVEIQCDVWDDEQKHRYIHMTLFVFVLRPVRTECCWMLDGWSLQFFFRSIDALHNSNCRYKRQWPVCNGNVWYERMHFGRIVAAVAIAVCRIYLFDFISCAEWLMYFIEYEINSPHVLLNSVWIQCR